MSVLLSTYFLAAVALMCGVWQCADCLRRTISIHGALSALPHIISSVASGEHEDVVSEGGADEECTSADGLSQLAAWTDGDPILAIIGRTPTSSTH